MKKYYSSYAFSIIEVMVGIFIFSLGLLSIYTLLISSLNINDYNKNAIIASNLSREQLELFRNIRDTNYKKLNVWNQQNPNEVFSASTKLFTAGGYYTLENNFSLAATFGTQVKDITSGFEEGQDKLLSASMTSYRLCLDINNMYTYDCSTSGNRTTPFYRYISLQNIIGQTDAYKVISKVIWYKKGYHEYDIKTIVTDWRRI